MIRSLTGRVVLVTVATAVVAVIVTALVAVPVAVRGQNAQLRTELVEKSAVAVELLADERQPARERIVRSLRQDGIEVFLIRRGVVDHPGLPDRVVQRVAGGTLVDTRAGGKLVVGRPLSGVNSGVVLTRDAATGIALRVLGSVWIALLAGLLGGVLAGALLARVIVRPFRLAASAAGKLSAGDRSVRISRRGPDEAAELADAFNQLAAALQTSEGRERDFLLSVSHELRTPLATIRGYAEALADGVMDAEKAAPTMIAEAERLDRLISDLLVLSRLEAADLPLDIVAVDLTELIRAAGDAWRARWPALTLELPDHPVVVRTDPVRIRQVIDGLCENALRVVPAGRPLVLAVRDETPVGGRDEAPVGGRDEAAMGAHDAATVEVRDGGPGLTDDDLAVAFERGALNRKYRGVRKVGSGLGLALAARLVTRLGGRITAGHAPEGGAMFTVRLPY
ncbi:HAMP domain-containing protein [Actinoplanes sp. TBRC 11911]|uniref:sensor histidine kinase n=1 Tax=Actinoplanes sp. TBRC 11911 TaxID=2729386 RepID=UPI00145F561A|nr:histidine kinase dimerization/phospho-acceptor domain-containing protein [Actinoplanes sp. TBRC 11911]NMO51253.1 HAMP domain-containing protein [Actinoplanes sp. TBRC 11911]